MEDMEKKVIMLMIESKEDDSHLEEAVEILSTAIKEGYDNNRLLKLRAQVYEMQGNFPESRNDISIILQSNPDSVEYLLWKCILDEALGVDKALCIECYNRVIQRKGAILGDRKSQDMEYILLSLLAENPDGPRMAKEFMETFNDSETISFTGIFYRSSIEKNLSDLELNARNHILDDNSRESIS